MRGLAVMALALVVGCGSQPQIASDNLELLQSLATATGAKRIEWVDAHIEKVDALVADHKATAAERAAFEPIYAASKAGDWGKAQTLTRQLSVGQRLNRIADARPKKPEHRAPPKGT